MVAVQTSAVLEEGGTRGQRKRHDVDWLLVMLEKAGRGGPHRLGKG